MNRLIFLSLFLMGALSSCHWDNKRIKGNGTVVTQARNASSFTDVKVSGDIHLYIRQDSVFSVRVETDENLQKYILVTEDNGVLRIRQEDNTSLDVTGRTKVYVSAPLYKRLDASGACEITSENKISSAEMLDIDLSGASHVKLDLQTPKVEVSSSGAGSVALRGATKDFSVGGSGSTSIKCLDLMAENVDVGISGAGNAEVFASVKLDVSVSGAGHVRYKGNAVVSKSISGAGGVSKID